MVWRCRRQRVQRFFLRCYKKDFGEKWSRTRYRFSTLGSAWRGAGTGQTGGFALWVAASSHLAGWRLVGVVWLRVACWVGAAGGLRVPSGLLGYVGVRGVALPWSRALSGSLSLGVYPGLWGEVA